MTLDLDSESDIKGCILWQISKLTFDAYILQSIYKLLLDYCIHKLQTQLIVWLTAPNWCTIKHNNANLLLDILQVDNTSKVNLVDVQTNMRRA